MTVLSQRNRVIRRRLLDRVRALGVARDVDGYEAGSSPTNTTGLYCAVVLGPGVVATGASTLAYTAWAQTFVVHLFRLLPLDDDTHSEQVDPELADAAETVLVDLNTVTGFGDGVEVDILGAYGDRPRTAPGYLDWDSAKYRTVTITCGFVIYNAMEQART